MTTTALITGRDPARPDIFDSLRAGFAAVAAQARDVRIDYARLAAYAGELPDKPPANVLDVTHHYVGPPEAMAAYILALDSLNFGSGYKPLLKGEGWRMVQGSLYFTISTRLKEYFEQDGPLTASAMADINGAKVASILGLSPAREWSARFARQCARHLNETGQLVAEQYQGRFLALAEGCNGSAAKLVEILTGLDNFNDVHDYRGLRVAFHKRAQITAADLQLAFRRLGRNLFDDIDRLTLFADNAVPHVLRTDGVLQYTPALAARIAAGEELASGAPEEVEIRACAAHAAELLATAGNKRVMDVDHILWHRSAEDARYQGRTHRTLSGFY